MKSAHELMGIAVKAQERIAEQQAAEQKRMEAERAKKYGQFINSVLKDFEPRALAAAEQGSRSCQVCEIPPADYFGTIRAGNEMLFSKLTGASKELAERLMSQPLGFRLTLRLEPNSYKDSDTLEYISNPKLYLVATW